MTSSPEPENTAEAAHSQGMTGTLSMNQESSQATEEKISILFQAAVIKLDGIDARAKGQKIKVVRDLARELEGKIPMDTIAIEIVQQLHGKVSERLVHDCLEEKYKRKHRVENARKQTHRKQISNTDLASFSN